jgi:signal transduction histidine kinase
VSFKSIILDYNKNYLNNIIELISLDAQNIKNLDLYAKNIHDKTSLGVKIVDADKHIIRRYGVDADKSEIVSVEKKFRYNQQDIYIQLYMTLNQIMDDFYMLYIKIAIIIFVVIVMAFYISRELSKRVLYDIKQIRNFLDDISNKDYEAVVKPKYFYEFLEISLMLKNLVKRLYTRDKHKKKYTQKLRLVNKKRNKMISAMSKDLKTPLSSIMKSAQELQEEKGIDTQEIISNIEKIYKVLDKLKK